jgi:hypothetical protein
LLLRFARRTGLPSSRPFGAANLLASNALLTALHHPKAVQV